MFSPFCDASGTPKGLAEVTWDDLSQLATLDEGFVLEFKRDWTPSVQRKVPKIIASFANSRGGWLVVGIEDDTHAVPPRSPAARRTSARSSASSAVATCPPPRPLTCAFCPIPPTRSAGVVIVRVGEGDFPPYVADGIVEIREGSTSGPAHGRRARGALRQGHRTPSRDRGVLPPHRVLPRRGPRWPRAAPL